MRLDNASYFICLDNFTSALLRQNMPSELCVHVGLDPVCSATEPGKSFGMSDIAVVQNDLSSSKQQGR